MLTIHDIVKGYKASNDCIFCEGTGIHNYALCICVQRKSGSDLTDVEFDYLSDLVEKAVEANSVPVVGSKNDQNC